LLSAEKVEMENMLFFHFKFLSYDIPRNNSSLKTKWHTERVRSKVIILKHNGPDANRFVLVKLFKANKKQTAPILLKSPI